MLLKAFYLYQGFFYKKVCCKRHRSFNFRCGLILSTDRSGQPVAVIRKSVLIESDNNKTRFLKACCAVAELVGYFFM